MGQGTLCLRPDGRRYDFGMPRMALLVSLPNMAFLPPYAQDGLNFKICTAELDHPRRTDIGHCALSP